MIGTVSAGLANSLAGYAASQGADKATLLEKADIAPALLLDPDNRVPMDNYRTLMRTAKDMLDNPALALDFGAAEPIEKHSVVGLVCHSAATMGEAYMQMSRYARLVIDVESGTGLPRFGMEVDGNDLWIIDNRPEPNEFPELSESTWARFCGDYDRHFDDGPMAREVHVTHPRPAHADAYDPIMRAPVIFNSDRNALLASVSWLSVPIQPENRYMFSVLTDRAEALMEKMKAAHSLRGEVENRLMPFLHTGDISMEQIADKMGLTRQTLYRKLKAEGTSFDTILDELRRTMALSYLRGGKVSVNEVAYLVGFSESSSFSRAFKRWTGKPPGQFRQAG